MKQEDALDAVLETLDEQGIPYMVTGSFASNLYGRIRSTQDADVVVQTNQETVRRFAEVFRGDFFADPVSAIDALRHHSMFNIIHVPTAFKVDIIFPRPSAYSAESFRRRTRRQFFGKERWFSTAEDTILSKLDWCKMTDSERQLDDAVGIAKVQGSTLDLPYLRKWSRELGVEDLLTRILQAVERKN